VSAGCTHPPWGMRSTASARQLRVWEQRRTRPIHGCRWFARWRYALADVQGLTESSPAARKRWQSHRFGEFWRWTRFYGGRSS
jgi:hypothetical protein